MSADLIIKIIADGAVIPVVVIGAYSLIRYVPSGQRITIYSRVLLAGLTAYLIAKLLGYAYQPSLERPFELLGVEARASFLDNPGFPSDHALFTAAITLAVWFGTHRKVPVIILTVLTAVVCIGRVIALVHTPLDVVAGVAVAAIGALWYLQSQPQPNPERKSLG